MQLLDFGDGPAARAVWPRELADVAAAVGELGFDRPRRVLVVVGGAAGLDEQGKAPLDALFSQVLLPVARDWDAVIVDGGTDSGVMRVLGQATRAAVTSVPLVGVAVNSKVSLPGGVAGSGGRQALERHHTHFVLVPGSAWGDESPWLARVATETAAGAPSVTVLINGGEIAFQDVSDNVAAGRPVLVIKGTGRAADRIAAALDGNRADDQATRLADSPLVTAAPWPDGTAVRAALESLAAAQGR